VSKALHKHSDVILQRLMALHPKLIDLSLGRVIALLEKLGDPQNHLPPVVHVAGTNAKGSVIAYMRAALEAGGYIVHVHISPHLVRFNERIRLSGSLITETALSELLEGCEKINADNPITFFEITTCAALVAFASEPADVVLLETGLGGRLDATNVIRQPAVTVLTPISFDHQQYLGNTLSQIGREKAGILKQGTPCVVATQPDGAMQSIIAKAQDLGVALYRQEEDWSVHQDGDQLVYENPRGRTILPLPNLVGRHQLNNAGIALAALDRLAACKSSEEARRFGLLKPLPGPLRVKLMFGKKKMLQCLSMRFLECLIQKTQKLFYAP
jgi:dihydrofolate synthase/folylpolyglutamate synthase